MPGTTIPRGNILNIKLFVVTITPSQVAANISAEQSFTVQGLAVGDYLSITANGAQTNGIIVPSARVSATNTLTVTFANNTGGALTPVAGAYGVVWGRAESPNTATDAQ